MTRRLLLATRSAGKVRELAAILAAAGFATETLDTAGIAERPDEAALELFDTFEANALAKARHFFARSGGIPTIADDSGLEVRALGGRPGVQSKRWSERPDLSGQALDDANNALLLTSLDRLADRTARYVCVVAFVDGEREIVTRGATSGLIARVPCGTSGFGYDPYFESDELDVSFGVATGEEKERVSHRGRAVRALLVALSPST